MMNDVGPPPKRQPLVKKTSAVVQDASVLPDGVNTPLLPPESPRKKRRWLKYSLFTVVAILVVTLLSLGATWVWYTQQLKAVSPGSSQKVRLTIEPGTDPSGIAALLEEKGLIRSSATFEWYVRLHGVANKLQAGPYRLSKGDDVPALIKHLTSGQVDTFSVTFLPGDTLTGHKKALKKAGFSDSVIEAAFKKQYDSPLFSDKPATGDLEGYIYGETYEFPADASVEGVLTRTFEEFYKQVQKENLVELYKKQGLSLYEGITLASIIQREVAVAADQQQVAQVFYLRLKKDMPLGSDVTYQYIADKTGVQRDPTLDSPYNTRRYKGLPPGPIASPGASALYAAAHPKKGDYLFFLSGDDDKTYFSRSDAEHEANIRDHCQKKCSIL